jgi:hypothetical protein
VLSCIAVITIFKLLDPEELLNEAQEVLEGFITAVQLIFEVILNESLLPDAPFRVILETLDLNSGVRV